MRRHHQAMENLLPPHTLCLSVVPVPVNYFYRAAIGEFSNSTTLSTCVVFLHGPPSPTCSFARVPAVAMDALLNALRPIAAVRQG